MATKIPPAKLTDAEIVHAFLQTLDHTLKPEALALRKIILASCKKLSERIKWNAPSYYYREDLLTFNFHDKKVIRLIFHHPGIVKIESPLLEGDYKDRRIAYFRDNAAVKSNKKELTRILNELVAAIENKQQSLASKIDKS